MCSHSLHLIEDDAKHRNVSINEEYQSATRQSAVGGRQLKAYTLAQTDIHWINCFGNGFFIAGSGPINWFVSRFAHQNPFGMVSFLLGNQPNARCPLHTQKPQIIIIYYALTACQALATVAAISALHTHIFWRQNVPLASLCSFCASTFSARRLYNTI